MSRPAASLRTRLLWAMLALLTIVSAVVGVVSTSILQANLVAQIDDQLASTTIRGRGAFDDSHSRRGDRRRESGAEVALQVPGQSVGTVGALVVDEVIVSGAYLDNDGAVRALDANQLDVLTAASIGPSPQTVHIPELGTYRAAQAEGPAGSEFVVAVPLASAQKTITQLAVTITAVALAAIVVAGVLGSVLIRSALAPLTRVTQSARRISDMPLDKGTVQLDTNELESDERTEVGQLAGAFNRMIGHVSNAFNAREASENKVRRFVSDASHELRTPLASIRGYAELTRLSPETLPADAAHALGRIEAESTRMTQLVEDLLLLARLDEGRQLEFGPVDVSALVSDAVADGRVAGPDHEWRYTPPEQPIWVNGDQARLHQIVLNLLTNARVHTPSGTTVTVSVSQAADDVVIKVHDNGPGIDEKVREHLFERFAMADSSRSRNSGSTGLGLAIADALARAHHGRISVDSQPCSTEFVLRLPLARSAGS